MSKPAVLLLLVAFVVASLSSPSNTAVLAHQRGRGNRYRFSLDRSLHRKFRGGRVKRPEYHGSGCPPNSLAHVNSSDESSFAMSVLFSAFQAETSRAIRRDQKKCFINVELAVEPGMSVGIVHIDFRGFAYVPEGASNETFAHLRASYSMLGAHGLIAERAFPSGFMDNVYEGMDFNPIVWTPCPRSPTVSNTTSSSSSSSSSNATTGNSTANVPLPAATPRSSAPQSYWIRIESRIVAQKAQLADEDVQITIDSSDATLTKGRLEYAMITRPCA